LLRSATWDQVRAFRLARQHLLERKPVDQLVGTVSATCGIQAQVQSAAELQLWARVRNSTSAAVKRALWEDRSLVRTWCMRGTLHLLASRDLPAYVAALRTHDRWWKGAWLRMIGCTAEELRSVLDSIAGALADTPLTREQLAQAVAGSVGPRLRERMLSGWAEMLKPAAFAGSLISGPPSGQNVTFVRPDRWLATWDEPDAANAWKQIVRGYLKTYGPASRDEFARWWGMQPAPAGRILAASADELVEVSVEGQPMWLLGEDLAGLQDASTRDSVRLLPAFDVYVIGNRPRASLVEAEFEERVFRQAGWVSPVVAVDGMAAGVWSYELERGALRVEVEPFRPLSETTKARIADEAELLGQFFDSEPHLSYRQ
jgi:Winged helix DNA-binding domain